MCRELICLGTLLSLLIGIPYARGDISDELIGYWTFDEGTISETAAADSSGKENHGIFVGSPTPVPGKVGTGALALGPSIYINIDSVADDIQGAADITLNAWLKTETGLTENTYWLSCNTAAKGNVFMLGITGGPPNGRAFIYDGGISASELYSVNYVNDNQWHMVTYVKSGSVGTLYVDGVLQGTHTPKFPPFRSDDLWSIGQEWDSGGPSQFFSDAGQSDEVAIWRRALTITEIVKIYNAGDGMPLLLQPVVSNPNPANESTDVPRDVVISWTSGKFADTHDVYLGTNFNDVNDASRTNPLGVLVSQGQTTSNYDPAGLLDFGQTYYWRIDEVNAPPASTIFKGDVWSFTVEPFAYPIAGRSIIATASSSNSPDEGPANTINGSGLDDNDQHSVELTHMWLSSMVGAQPSWIQYEFDRVYRLHQIWVWNHNSLLELSFGFGVKNATIEYSIDGTNWATLGTTHQFARAPGTDGYAHNTMVDLGGTAAKYVRLTANSNWGGILPQYGLSEVRFFYIPVNAREPYPQSGATGVDADVMLSWRAGREAAKHDVYLSTDQQAVKDETVNAVSIPAGSSYAIYDTGALELAQTYYWKINEVNMAETPTVWEGDVWSFTTRQFLIVDDFESYNDLETTDPKSNRIFNTWIDGYGVPANGSLVGYENPPFAEKTIVHSGKQSMPLFYSNTSGAAYSEAERTFAVGQDWTKHGIKTLSLWFSGDASNTAGQLYLKINGTKVTYDGQASNIAQAGWQAWNIDLASSGASLQNVTKLAVGIDGNGATGTLFFDDIRLYARGREFITPSAPDSTHLIGHWKFDGDTQDSSGRGNHGRSGVTPPAFVAGRVGSNAMNFRGADYVAIDGVVNDITSTNITLSAWIKTTQSSEGNVFAANDSASAHPLMFGVSGGDPFVNDGGNIMFHPAVNDDQWHLLTYVRSGATGYVYTDGLLRGTYSAVFSLATVTRWSIGQEWDNTTPSDFYSGAVDDARIYNYALSEGEVGWLAGKTQPYDKPF